MTELAPRPERRLIASAADEVAAHHTFDDYRVRRAANTLRRQHADLMLFARYLAEVQIDTSPERLQSDPEAWRGISWGLVASFPRWMLREGYAISSINVRLSTIKTYAQLAFQAGAIGPEQHALIRSVQVYQHKEIKRIDEKRQAEGVATRKGRKKAVAVSLTEAQRRALKQQPDTPQGRRDAVLMCLLLDHGLRCGEIAALQVSDVELSAGELRFYRPKVDKVQTHRLTRDTLNALQAWFADGAPASGLLLRKSAKSKSGDKLGAPGMSERAITKRVEYLGRRIGIAKLSAHDGRHNWATVASRNKTNVFALQEAGGWNSLAMPRRYVETAKVANEGVRLE